MQENRTYIYNSVLESILKIPSHSNESSVVTWTPAGDCPSPFSSASVKVLYPLFQLVSGEFIPRVGKSVQSTKPYDRGEDCPASLEGGGASQMEGSVTHVPHRMTHRYSSRVLLETVTSHSQIVPLLSEFSFP